MDKPPESTVLIAKIGQIRKVYEEYNNYYPYTGKRAEFGQCLLFERPIPVDKLNHNQFNTCIASRVD